MTLTSVRGEARAAPPRTLRVRGRRGGREVRPWHVAAFAGLLLVVAVGSLFVGVSDLTPLDLLDPTDRQVQILLVSRVPRLVSILLAGASMSVAGLIMQHLARNRFVSPSTAGTVESATLGFLVAVVFFAAWPLAAKMVLAVVAAMAGTAVFLAILRRIRLVDVIFVPLVGLMFGGVVRSITTFVAYRTGRLQAMSSWTSGDFSGVLRGRYELLYVVLAVTALGYVWANRFTIAGMGREVATNLGIDYQKVLDLGLAMVSIITGVVVVTVGAIPFLGLIVPNVVTLLLGDDLRRVLPLTALAGAGFVLVCDVVGRLVRHPYEIPVGTVVGVVGGAIFVALILRSDRRVA